MHIKLELEFEINSRNWNYRVYWSLKEKVRKLEYRLFVVL